MSLFFHETGKQVAVVSLFDVSFWLNLHCRMRFHAAKGNLLHRVSWPFTTRNMAVYSTKSGLLLRQLLPFGTFVASFSCTLCLLPGVTTLLPATYDCTRYFSSYASVCHDFSGDALQELQAKSKRKQNGLIGTSVHVPTMWAITVAPSLWHVCQDPRPCFKNCFLVPVRDSCGVADGMLKKSRFALFYLVHDVLSSCFYW